jgi:hypothetical protein
MHHDGDLKLADGKHIKSKAGRGPEADRDKSKKRERQTEELGLDVATILKKSKSDPLNNNLHSLHHSPFYSIHNQCRSYQA